MGCGPSSALAPVTAQTLRVIDGKPENIPGAIVKTLMRSQRRAGEDNRVPTRGPDPVAEAAPPNACTKKSVLDQTPCVEISQSSPRSKILQALRSATDRFRQISGSSRSRDLVALDDCESKEEIAADKLRMASADCQANVIKLMLLVESGGALGGLSMFARAYADESFCRRLLHKYNGDVKRSAEKLEVALRWREQQEVLISRRLFKPAIDLRIIGFDLGSRPVLYQCTRNQMLPNSVGLDQYVVRMLEAIDLMPPGVETITHIWDMHGLMLRMNLNPAAVLRLLGVFEGHFAGRMHELIIIDLPGVAKVLKDVIWPVVPESTKQKVHFCSAREAAEHVQEVCEAATSARIRAAMDENRNPSNTLDERRGSWDQYKPSTIMRI